MKNKFRLAALLFCLPLTGFADGGVDSKNYSVIWRRNVFALKAPSPPIVSVPVPVAPVPVKLMGIAAWPPHKWAAFRIQEPGKAARSVLLKAGAQEGALKVLEIETHSKQVKINNAGVIMTLSFEPDANGMAARGSDPGHAPLPVIASADAGDP